MAHSQAGQPPQKQAPQLFAPAIDVILVQPCGPINIGLVARACSNLAVRKLVLVAPQCNVADARIAQFAHGASPEHLAFDVVDSLKAAVATHRLVIGVSGRHHKAALPPMSLRALPADAGPCALVFGSEPSGLSNAQLALCHRCLTLPAGHLQPSYNLSHAVVLALYVMRFSQNAAGDVDAAASGPARGLRTHLLAAWQRVLVAHNYYEHVDEAAYLPKLKRFIETLPMSPSHVRILSGMLRHLARVPKT